LVAVCTIAGTTRWPAREFNQAAGPEIDVHPLGLLAVLIKLVAQHGDDDHQRADDKIEHVVA
jgi:hypothetical protein